MKMNGFLGSKRKILIVQPGSKILKEIQLAINNSNIIKINQTLVNKW
jgi:hypothetical protein